MQFAEIPPESDFLDVDGIPVVRLPGGECIAFEKSPGAEGYPYPNSSKAGLEGDALSHAEFAEWLATGYNRFDVSAWRGDSPR